MKPELRVIEGGIAAAEAAVEAEVQAALAAAAPDLPPPVQQEMPFAIVDGEPMSEPPRDLYIPPQALKVFLEAFEGPLDLLLYLIRRQNLDILDIPIAEITRQYMEYIELMHGMELELAGEYMLMAAMLAEIKSRMLLPRPAAEVTEEEDPRAELVRRLQEYERFKRAAEDIDGLPRLERDVFTASAEMTERKVVNIVPSVSLQEMLLAFKDVIQRAAMFASHHVARERLSVRQRMSEMLQRLQQDTFIDFIRLFEVSEGRMGVTVTFVALLELLREGLVEFVQAEAYGPIHVRPATAPRDWSEAITPDGDVPTEGNLVLALEPVFEEPALPAPAVAEGVDSANTQNDELAPVRAPVVDNGF